MLWNRRTVAVRETVANDEDEASCIVRIAHEVVKAQFPTFIDRMRQVGWKTNGGEIMTGAPKALLMSVQSGDLTVESNGDIAIEGKKDA